MTRITPGRRGCILPSETNMAVVRRGPRLIGDKGAMRGRKPVSRASRGDYDELDNMSLHEGYRVCAGRSKEEAIENITRLTAASELKLLTMGALHDMTLGVRQEGKEHRRKDYTIWLPRARS